MYHIFVDESFCSAALRNIKDHYFPLQFCCIAPILGKLHSFGVITDHQKDVIDAKELESDQIKYLLDEVIIPSLSANESVKFEYFVKVMKESDNTIDNIWADILGGSLVTLKFVVCSICMGLCVLVVRTMIIE